MEKVSVVVTLYNKTKYISASLQSVLDQTYTNTEIIVVDDHSSDDSLSIVRAYTDNRIKVVQHGCNLGQYAALNSGIRAAEGSIVSFLDADDTWLPNYLDEVMHKFQECPRAGLVYTLCVNGPLWDLEGDDVYGHALRQGFITTTSCLSSPKRCLESVGLFPSVFGVDDALCFNLAKYFPVALIKLPLVLHKQERDSTTMDRVKVANGRAELIEMFREEMRIHGGEYLYGMRLMSLSLEYLYCGCFEKSFLSYRNGLRELFLSHRPGSREMMILLGTSRAILRRILRDCSERVFGSFNTLR